MGWQRKRSWWGTRSSGIGYRTWAKLVTNIEESAEAHRAGNARARELAPKVHSKIFLLSKMLKSINRGVDDGRKGVREEAGGKLFFGDIFSMLTEDIDNISVVSGTAFEGHTFPIPTITFKYPIGY